MPIISPTAISPYRIGGKSWSSYWATLISATVETAAPTHIVMRFPSARTVTVDDFTVIGFTIASLSWTGAVLTIVLTEPVYVFHENLTIVFEITGQTAIVTNNVTDLVSEAWYDFVDESTVTKDAGNIITGGVANKLGVAARDMTIVGGTPEWSVDGVLLLNTDGEYLKTAPFTFNQPESIYIVAKLIEFTAGAVVIFDGNTNFKGKLEKNTPGSTQIGAGAHLINNNISADTWHVFRILFNGANSKFNISLVQDVSGNAGTFNMDGFTLGAFGGAAVGFANMQAKEAILRSGTDAAHEVAILKRLWYKHFKTFNTGKLVISFDDARSSQYTAAFPVFVAKGVKGTFYLIANEVDNAGNITWAQAKEMYEAGMDMQCHTDTHPHMTTLNEAQVLAELNASSAKFVAAGLPSPNHLAYPYGEYNDNVKSWSSTLRKTGRGASAPVASLPLYLRNSDKMALNCAQIDGLDAVGMTALKARIDYAASHYTAGLIFCHGIDGVGELTTAQLEEIIDYAIAAGVEVVSMTQLYAQMEH